jgi:hypothetical protein
MIESMYFFIKNEKRDDKTDHFQADFFFLQEAHHDLTADEMTLIITFHAVFSLISV